MRRPLLLTLCCTLWLGCDAGPDRDTIPGRLTGTLILFTTRDGDGNRTNAFADTIGSIRLRLGDLSERVRTDYRITITDSEDQTRTIQGTYILVEGDTSQSILLDHDEFGGFGLSVEFDGENTLILTTGLLPQETMRNYGIDFDFQPPLTWTFRRN